MNAPVKAETFKPFNALAAYESSQDDVRALRVHLETALGLLEMECARRELRGEDTTFVRAGVSRIRREAFK